MKKNLLFLFFIIFFANILNAGEQIELIGSPVEIRELNIYDRSGDEKKT